MLIAWIGILLLFNWVFSEGHIADLRLGFSSKGYVDGYVIDYESTNVSVNDELMYQYYYSYALDGEVFQGTSYLGGYYDVDEKVTVEHLKGDPSVSRIKGADNTLSGLGFMIVLALAAIGLTWWVLAYFGKRLKDIKTLSRGIVVEAKQVDKVMTNTTINDRTLFKLYYEYEAHHETYQILHKTTYPANFRLSERVIYHQNIPEKGVLVAKLPESIQNKLPRS